MYQCKECSLWLKGSLRNHKGILLDKIFLLLNLKDYITYAVILLSHIAVIAYWAGTIRQ
jgi:hypothetical protein